MVCQSFLEVIPFINLLSQVQVAVAVVLWHNFLQVLGCVRLDYILLWAHSIHLSVDSCFLLRKPRHVFSLCGVVLPLWCSGLLHLAGACCRRVGLFDLFFASYTGEDKQT